MATRSDAPPPPPTSVLFARGVIARLAYWPALRIAVEHGWGGPESRAKRTWLASTLVDDFEDAAHETPDAPFVEERLLQALVDEFDTVLEDGSAADVAADVVRLWGDVGRGREDVVREFEERAARAGGQKVQVEEAAGAESDWEDETGEDDGESGEEDAMDEDAPQLLDRQAKPAREEPDVDEDGFTLVKGKGRKNK